MIFFFLLSISVLVLIIILFISFLRYDFYNKKNMKNNKFDSKKFWFYVVSIVLLAILTYSLFIVNDRIQRAEKVFNKNITNEKLTQKDSLKLVEYEGTLGDLIGGVLNPIIALLGVFAGGLAFYMQYKANLLIQEQFKIQQFESQFYEMLRLHRENLTEMIIEGYVHKYENDDKSEPAIKKSKEVKITSGKKVFVTMVKEFEAIHLICKATFHKYHNSNNDNKEKLNSKLGKQLIFDHAYYVFFLGINSYKIHTKRYIAKDQTGLLDGAILQYIKELEKHRDNHENFGIKIVYNYFNHGVPNSENFKSETLWLSFNYKPFSGHQSILAHYYRLLFQTVKFVVKKEMEIFPYENKRDSLRVLRSMLSNYEQVLLFYNWHGGFGPEWEEKNIENRKSKKGNNFFTDYRMIHNIPPDLLLKDINLEEIFNNHYRDFLFENNRKNDDSLFELVNIARLK